MKNNKLKKSTVTVVMSALNEEQNIQALLRSVLMQKKDGYILEKIIVISDGSTDGTCKRIKELKSKKILLIDEPVRMGKSMRLNQLFLLTTSDVVVQLDADITLSNRCVVENLIQPIIKNRHVGLCGGNAIPLEGNTLIQRAIRCSFLAYYPLRKKLRGGNNIFSIDGKILAFSKKFIKEIHIPETTIADDVYAYYYSLSHGYTYKYVANAIIFFHLPHKLSDHIKQNIRFSASPLRMYKYFEKKLVDREEYIPFNLFIYYTFKQFIKHPILCIYIINIYCRIRAKQVGKFLTAKWKVAYSTKKSYES